MKNIKESDAEQDLVRSLKLEDFDDNMGEFLMK